MNNASTEYLCSRDARLQEVIENVPELRVETSDDVFYDVLSCVIGQQIHYRRITPVFARFLELFPEQYPHPETVIQLTSDVFSRLKISSQKHQTVLRVAHWWIDNAMDAKDWHSLSDDEIRTILSSIKGIGNWTIAMILLFTFQRPDIFPADDYGLKKAMTALYGLNPDENLKKQMAEMSAVWMPHRSLACRYLWAWKERL
jgi:DNA-3-methyladenine glycosylase II